MLVAIKKILFFVFIVLISFISVAQNTTIPDANFEQALIDLGIDSGTINGAVLTSNIKTIKSLNVASKNIGNLTGIQDFEDLEILNCEGNQLTNLNTTNNTNLEQLFCNNNYFNNLDVTKNINLSIFWCHNNLLLDLDVTQNTNLISLVCNFNQLSSLDVTKNINLNVLVCEYNQISTLNVKNNSTLNTFKCGYNLLSNLDVTNNTDLTILNCEQNQLSTLNLTNNNRLNTLSCFGNQLTTLDLTQNISLVSLDCSNNNLCNIHVNNGNNNNLVLINFNLNPDLNCVVVDNVNEDHSIWQPASFTNYVNTTNDCSNFIPVDSLNDFIGISYTLPIINNGNYFTESGGNGIQLNTGDIITTPQIIYIYNETICNNNESSFNVLISNADYYIPKYFTPNNDGSHDLWKVIDTKNSINNITIYNRYGKLIKFLQSNTSGWDGTYNGKLLTNGSYWYIITLNTGETVKGYFALKR